MALVVEDGSGLPTAESYVSVSDADAYFAARNGTAWAALAADAKEAALRQATDYIDAVYSGRWSGDRATDTQALAWPRFGVVLDGVELASDTLPAQLVRATCELAVRASSDSLLSDQGAQVKSEQVGPIAVTYADGARQDTRYAFVEALLAPLLVFGMGQVRMVRA